MKIVLDVDRKGEMAYIVATISDNTRVLMSSYWRVTGVKKESYKKYAIINNGRKIGTAYNIDEVKEMW